MPPPRRDARAPRGSHLTVLTARPEAGNSAVQPERREHPPGPAPSPVTAVLICRAVGGRRRPVASTAVRQDATALLDSGASDAPSGM
ncbi:hypothetical protein GCM10018773_52750 [Streptomyces candidus]|nr:hypothetical protein GCM10018773_52750 [Streptomyces candidus]